MKDFKTVQEEAADHFMSITIQSEFNCKEAQNLILEYIWYKENMGDGDVVRTDTTPEEWKSVSSGSVEDTILKFSCGKRWWKWW
jgi:hypothetical protein